MFKLWGKHILPSSLPPPCIPEAGPGFGYQAAKAPAGTHPASWHGAATADASFSSAKIKQVPTGGWLAARRGNSSRLRLLWGNERASVGGRECVLCVCWGLYLPARASAYVPVCATTGLCEFPDVKPRSVSVHESAHVHLGVRDVCRARPATTGLQTRGRTRHAQTRTGHRPEGLCPARQGRPSLPWGAQRQVCEHS